MEGSRNIYTKRERERNHKDKRINELEPQLTRVGLESSFTCLVAWVVLENITF